jgi:hypothetical protein
LLVSLDSTTAFAVSAIAQKNCVENGVAAGMVTGVLAASDAPAASPAIARLASSVSAVVHTLSADRYSPTLNAPPGVPPLLAIVFWSVTPVPGAALAGPVSALTTRSAGTCPVPLSATSNGFSFGSSDAILSDAVLAPAVVGANRTTTFRSAPGARVKAPPPDWIENCVGLAPTRVVDATFRSMLPVFDTWKVRSLKAFVSTVP